MAYISVFEGVDGLDSSELFIGVVSAVGSPLEYFFHALKCELTARGYEYVELRLSRFPEAMGVPGQPSPEGTQEFRGISNLMNMGNEARRISGRGDVLALFASAEIVTRRKEIGDTKQKRAYVFRQLKHPHEVYALRDLYGEGFHLIGAYCNLQERLDHLKQNKMMTFDEAKILVDRDEHEEADYGQNVRGTFHLSDVFVRVSKEREPEGAELKRFYRLLFGELIITPTIVEFGMYVADASALRSAQMGRQVGASILSPSGDVISLGSNEVPAAGGGQYWEGERGDARDHILGIDSSDQARSEMFNEIGKALVLDWDKIDEGARKDARARLSRTKVNSLTEFGRAVHAEMDAILSAQRSNRGVIGTQLFTTTFPCHNCAKHIVTSGISTVTYIEPYPKSQALLLHGDAIEVEGTTRAIKDRAIVGFTPFVGVAPRKFSELFSIVSPSGIVNRRKDESGRPVAQSKGSKLSPRAMSYTQLETVAGKLLSEIAPKFSPQIADKD